jgi:hypothetical protein
MLICVWDEAVGEMPGRRWDPYQEVEIFPFLDWANELLVALDADEAGTISSRLARHELDLETEQRRRGVPPTRLPS